MKADFAHRLQAAQAARGTDQALLIAPRLSFMPLPLLSIDDPFLPFGKAIINATRDLVCAYVFDLAAYLALGAAGAVALERTIAYANANSAAITVLHGLFVGAGYVEAAADSAFNVDAVTLARTVDAEAYQARGLGVCLVAELEMFEVAGTNLKLTLAGKSVLYAGRGEDFAERVREALQN